MNERGWRKKEKKNCREWQQNGRGIYEVKEQLGGQGVPWDNDRKMKSEILVSDFWSRAVTGQDQSYSRGSWWLKLSRDLAHGCNEVSAEPQNVSYMSRAFIPVSTTRTLKALLSVKKFVQFWFTATLKSLLYSPVADTWKNHQNVVKVIIL